MSYQLCTVEWFVYLRAGRSVVFAIGRTTFQLHNIFAGSSRLAARLIHGVFYIYRQFTSYTGNKNVLIKLMFASQSQPCCYYSWSINAFLFFLLSFQHVFESQFLCGFQWDHPDTVPLGLPDWFDMRSHTAWGKQFHKICCKRMCYIQWRQRVSNIGDDLPFPSPLLPFPPLPSPPHLIPSPTSPPLPLEVGPLNPARGLGERCWLPQRGLGRSPSRNRIWCILALKSGIWWQKL